MRVSDQQRYDSFMRNVQQRLVNLTRIQQELGTGKSIFSPSDNVLQADRGLRAEDRLASNAQFLRNVDDGLKWVQAADDKLQAAVDVLSEIEALALTADNSSQNADDRSNTAIQTDQKLEALMALVNGSSNDRYLFGGHGTTAKPFVEVRDAEGRIQGAQTNQDTIAGRIYRQIGENDDIAINVPGDRLFQPVGGAGTDEDVFYVIAALRDTIGNNNTPPEGSEDTRSNEHLREALAQIRERIAEQQTYLGSAGQRLEQTKSRLKEEAVTLTDRLEQAEGVDITDLASRLSVEEGAYNALATISTRLLRQTLVDYMG